MLKDFLRVAVLGICLASTSCWAVVTPEEAMNMAGLQRTLGQRIAKDYLMMGSGVRVEVATKQLKDTIALFENHHNALVEFAPNPTIHNKLVEIDKTWQAYKQLVQTEPDKEQAVGMLAVNDQLLEQCQKLTDLVEQNNGGESSRLVNRSGWNRVLSQRIAMLYMAKNWGIKAPGLDDSFTKSVGEFDTVMAELHAAGTPNPEIANALRKAEAQWKFTRTAVDLATPGNYIPTAMASSADTLFKQMNELTRLYAGLSASN
ncbi:PilJ/NarX-like methyl-accepting chemotaxis transducer [Pseudomonas duriflava]|uniref:PilJ/NarX-like methyl-accepting chemotaxis transducer n=1 Tax=Pseudomonas duriflava TaxID=459528 RepID=A0A562QDZ4_9PSED|nr:type IV pili methyl-accepting chemotaxis transducer N-terminal domain-containing protein [Pseudomonas duriflava]TWI54923.1 PilJ/NarX-like methyl-accepting chemotaxis transducer [Pseudomonas duriflava]